MNKYGTPEAGGIHQVNVVDHFVSRAGWTFVFNGWLMVSLNIKKRPTFKVSVHS